MNGWRSDGQREGRMLDGWMEIELMDRQSLDEQMKIDEGMKIRCIIEIQMKV